MWWIILTTFFRLCWPPLRQNLRLSVTPCRERSSAFPPAGSTHPATFPPPPSAGGTQRRLTLSSKTHRRQDLQGRSLAGAGWRAGRWPSPWACSTIPRAIWQPPQVRKIKLLFISPWEEGRKSFGEAMWDWVLERVGEGRKEEKWIRGEGEEEWGGDLSRWCESDELRISSFWDLYRKPFQFASSCEFSIYFLFSYKGNQGAYHCLIYQNRISKDVDLFLSFSSYVFKFVFCFYLLQIPMPECLLTKERKRHRRQRLEFKKKSFKNSIYKSHLLLLISASRKLFFCSPDA